MIPYALNIRMTGATIADLGAPAGGDQADQREGEEGAVDDLVRRLDQATRGDQRADGKAGGRFSRIARTPSRTSGKVKVSISRASDWSKMGPACRSQLFSARFV